MKNKTKIPNKKQERNSSSRKSITIAHIISVFSTAILCAMVYVGLSTFEAIEGSASILITIIGACLLFVILFLLVHSKSADNNFKAWRVAEVVCLGFYLVVIALSLKPVSNCVTLYANRDTLVEAVNSDISKISTLIKDFQAAEKEYITEFSRLKNFVEGGKNSRLSKLAADKSMENFLVANNMIISSYSNKACKYIGVGSKPLHEVVNERMNSLTEDVNYIRVDGVAYYGSDRLWSKKLNTIIANISSFNVLKFGSIKDDINNLTNHVPEKLNALATHLSNNKYFKFVKVNKNKKNMCRLVYPLQRDDINYKLEDMQFSKTLEEILKGYSPLGIGLAVVLHLFILCCYIFAERSRKLSIKQQRDGGFGRPIM
jgi:hypothetical protein